MSRVSSQKKIGFRPPRIERDPAWEIPFVVGVLSDLSVDGAADLPGLAERIFSEVDSFSFDKFIEAQKPRVTVEVDNTLTSEGKLRVDITIGSMDDFSPAAVARKVPGLNRLFEIRKNLNLLLARIEGKAKLEKALEMLAQNPELTRRLHAEMDGSANTQNQATVMTGQHLSQLQEGRAETTLESIIYEEPLIPLREPGEPLEVHVKTLINAVVSMPEAFGKTNLRAAIEGIIAGIDYKLTGQINKIIHHPRFQKMESAWRGLWHVVSNTQTDEMLKIKVLNVSKKELTGIFQQFNGANWEQSPLYCNICRPEHGVPFGVLVGDYCFDYGLEDVAILNGMARLCATVHAPFLASAAPSLLGLDDWQDLCNLYDVSKIFYDDRYLAWRLLRQSEEARYLGLTMPRFLARLPYGIKTVPVEEFCFEEYTEGGDSSYFVWANSAYAMAANITRAFKDYGWCTQVRGREGGGMVSDLPCHAFQTVDGMEVKCPTEVALCDRLENELAKNGLTPLFVLKNTSDAVFISAQSLQRPKAFSGQGAVAANQTAQLSVRLPYLFFICRFVHLLQYVAAQTASKEQGPAEVEKRLRDWVSDYVLPHPTDAFESMTAAKPLSGAELYVTEWDAPSGKGTIYLCLRPHYQFELAIQLQTVFAFWTPQ
ncbi:MAG TPA: type VI secretion system contractile sheath large subunit [Verrucomicrobiae bacterium]|jgi:type VI secretion system protein ImpC